MNADKLAECLREALEELYWPHSNPALRKKCEQTLAEYDAQAAQAGNSLLIGTTPGGRPYGLHGTKESVEAVSDLIEAQAAQPVGAPDGWVMVPREPTAEMAQVGRHAAPYRATDVYKAMILAAPQPPAQPSADAVSIAANISTRPEFAKYESPLILDIVRETLKAARAAEGGE